MFQKFKRPLSVKEGRLGVMPNVLGLSFSCVGVHSVFFFNLEMCHFFSHVLLKDMYQKCNESFMYSVRNLKWTKENLKCHSHYKVGLYASWKTHL